MKEVQNALRVKEFMESILISLTGYMPKKEKSQDPTLNEVLHLNLKNLFIPVCIITDPESDFVKEMMPNVPEGRTFGAAIISIQYLNNFMC